MERNKARARGQERYLSLFRLLEEAAGGNETDSRKRWRLMGV